MNEGSTGRVKGGRAAVLAQESSTVKGVVVAAAAAAAAVVVVVVVEIGVGLITTEGCFVAELKSGCLLGVRLGEALGLCISASCCLRRGESVSFGIGDTLNCWARGDCLDTIDWARGVELGWVR